MTTDSMLVLTLIIATIGLALLALGQSKQINVLKDANARLRSGEEDPNELPAAVKEKLKTDGEIKAIKYVREQTGMSLVEAKQFVDRLK